MAAIRPTPRQRLGAASITALLVAALGYAFIVGLGVDVPRVASKALAAFTVLPPPPPPEPIRPNPVRDTKREGAAAPANRKSKATPVTAPVPIVPLTPPPPIPVAVKPAAGTEATTGAAPVPGPGTGAGGIGNGTGSGASGNGEGGGGDTPPRQTGGRLSTRDLPADLKQPGRGGTVSVLFTVGVRGRVTDCEVTRSSGNAELDDLTCRLIEQRFRFEPSRDADGRPVESMVEENETWVFD